MPQAERFSLMRSNMLSRLRRFDGLNGGMPPGECQLPAFTDLCIRARLFAASAKQRRPVAFSLRLLTTVTLGSDNPTQSAADKTASAGPCKKKVSKFTIYSPNLWRRLLPGQRRIKQ
jgi:hypothetical protein